MSNYKNRPINATFNESHNLELQIKSFSLDLMAEGKSWALIIDTALFKYHTGRGCLNSEEIISIALEACLNSRHGKY